MLIKVEWSIHLSNSSFNREIFCLELSQWCLKLILNKLVRNYITIRIIKVSINIGSKLIFWFQKVLPTFIFHSINENVSNKIDVLITTNRDFKEIWVYAPTFIERISFYVPIKLISLRRLDFHCSIRLINSDSILWIYQVGFYTIFDLNELILKQAAWSISCKQEAKIL